MSDSQPPSKELVATLNEIAVRALAVGPKDHNITLDEIRAISKAAELLALSAAGKHAERVVELEAEIERMQRVTEQLHVSIGELIGEKAELSAALCSAHEPADDAANRYALALLETLVDKFGRPEGWQPLPDVLGKLTQIDNVISGLLARAAPPPVPEQSELTVTLNGRQVAELYDFMDLGAERTHSLTDGYVTDISIQWFDERPPVDGLPSPAGYYAWFTEYPEEGSLYLDDQPSETKCEEVLGHRDEALIDEAYARHIGMACTRPHIGWHCTRAVGHDGPCAAVPVEDAQ